MDANDPYLPSQAAAEPARSKRYSGAQVVAVFLVGMMLGAVVSETLVMRVRDGSSRSAALKVQNEALRKQVEELRDKLDSLQHQLATE